MHLYPALRHKGEIVKGQSDDSHNTIAVSLGIDAPDSIRGFTTDGKLFLNRDQALKWLQRNDIKTFRKLSSKAHYEGLHSQFLAKAYGVAQKPEAVRMTQEAISSSRKPEKVDLSDKKALVFDRGGLYIYCAEKLSEKYKKVYYYLAEADAYPTSQKCAIGSNLKGIERVHSFWDVLDKVDIVYFFDCYDGDLQHWLRAKGYTVFGSGKGEKVEIDKVYFLELLEELGLPCPKTRLTESMDELCEYLKEHDGETLFLKNLHRGDFESRKFTSMAQSRPFLNDLKKRLGSASDTLEVLVQFKIDAECEVGYDGFQVDGQFTDNCIIGYEIKDAGFVAKVFEQTPEIIKGTNDAFSETFKKLGYRGNYSTELRITKEGIPYYIDATCRVPSPPGELVCEIYENWAEATWEIANGVLPVLVPKAKYGAIIILTSGWYDEHELHVKFPKKYAGNIKLKNHTVRDGEIYCIPNGNGAFFGAVITYADKLDEAIEECLKIVDSIEADELDYDKGLFDKAKEQMEGGEKFGIRF